MKYLKTHEEHNFHFKKYIIWEMNNIIVLFKILNYTTITSYDQKFKLKRLELYHQKNDKIINRNIHDVDKEIYYKSPQSIIDNLMYQSDQLEDCLKYMKYKIDISNYNL